MKKLKLIIIFLILNSTFYFLNSFAQTNSKYKPYPPNPYLHPPVSQKMLAGCATATQQDELNINNVRATIGNDGQNWSGRPGWGYEIPKVPSGQTAVHCSYAGGMWIGGFDAGNNFALFSVFNKRGTRFSA